MNVQRSPPSKVAAQNSPTLDLNHHDAMTMFNIMSRSSTLRREFCTMPPFGDDNPMACYVQFTDPESNMLGLISVSVKRVSLHQGTVSEQTAISAVEEAALQEPGHPPISSIVFNYSRMVKELRHVGLPDTCIGILLDGGFRIDDLLDLSVDDLNGLAIPPCWSPILQEVAVNVLKEQAEQVAVDVQTTFKGTHHPKRQRSEWLEGAAAADNLSELNHQWDTQFPTLDQDVSDRLAAGCTIKPLDSVDPSCNS